MIPSKSLRTWTRQVGDHTYTISTDPSQIDVDAISAAFDSDLIYWAKSLPREAMQLCVQQSFCFGLYVPKDSSQNGTAITNGTESQQQQQEMVGFARLVTDHVTFGYLTDVYVLAEHQGKGLGRWMMQCLEEVLVSWPHLRRCLLFTRDRSAAKLYRETIGAKETSETTSSRLICMERPGTISKALGEGR